MSFMSRALTVFKISYSIMFKEEILDKEQISKVLGKKLSFSMGVHLEAKYLLKCIALNLKSISNLLSMYNGGIKGIVFLLQNVLRRDKYVLELVEGSVNLLANLS